MGTQRAKSQPRKMKPVFLVLCEGETEETYLEYLRRTYRSPIKIVPKITGDSICQKLVAKKIQEVKLSPNEVIKAFLMYDRDVESINAKIDACKGVFLLSNPCVELWFLLHNKPIASSVSTDSCIASLKKIGGVWSNYEKPIITETQKANLTSNVKAAIKNAKMLTLYDNPSSSIYILIEEIMRSI